MLNNKNNILTDDAFDAEVFVENGNKAQCVGLIDTEGGQLYSAAPIPVNPPFEFAYDIHKAGIIQVEQKSFTLLHGMN